MTSVELTKLLVGSGLLIITLSIIFAIANMTGLISSKKTPRYNQVRLIGFVQQEGWFDSPFKRHGIAMIGMVIGMILIGVGLYIGGIDLAKEILRQFGVGC